MNTAERCPVCDETDVRAVAPYRHSDPAFAGRSRAVCGGCGMIFTSPMPDEAALAAYNARFWNAQGIAPAERVAGAFHSGLNRLRVAHVERYLDSRRLAVSTVLEAGPGGGNFARHWLARHPSSRYHAVESDESCHPALKAQGITLHRKPEDISGECPVDLVILSHVLEHTTDPCGFLRRMTAPLRRGGALFVEVPCRDFEFKKKDEPHLLFFDKPPMGRMLDELGFKEIQLSYHGRELDELRSRPGIFDRIDRMRTRLVEQGLVAPFAFGFSGLDVVKDPLERALVGPYEAHREKTHPARWLRAAALKS